MTHQPSALTRVQYDYWTRQARFVARQVAPEHLASDMVSLVKSLRTYDPSKNDNLGAYVLQRMRWAMLEALRFWRAGNRRDTERGVFYDEVALGDVVAVLSVSSAVSTDKIDLARALEKLPPRRRQLMRAYLGCDDVAGAAASVGMSTKSGWQHHWKAVRTLRSLLATTR